MTASGPSVRNVDHSSAVSFFSCSLEGSIEEIRLGNRDKVGMLGFSISRVE